MLENFRNLKSLWNLEILEALFQKKSTNDDDDDDLKDQLQEARLLRLSRA